MMYRLAAPLALGSVFTIFKRRRKSPVETEFSAISPATIGMRNDEPVQVFQRTSTDDVNPASRFRLALKGSAVCAHIPTVSFCDNPRTPLQLEEAVKKLRVDDEWRDAVIWSASHLCDESDLACGEEMIGRRPSQEVRLNRLLTVLVTKSENGYGKELVEQDILSILFDFCTQFAASNRGILINAMKVLANIVAQNEICAVAVANSEWLQRLAAMVSMNSLEENLLAEKVCINALSVLANTAVRLETDVYQLYRSEEEPAIDIIFVHGLRGGVFRTWRAKDDSQNFPRTQCWPRSWLPCDVNFPIRILALDYVSSLLHFRGVIQTLASRSLRFQNQLKAAGIGTRPVVFICHSMGKFFEYIYN